MNCDINRIAWLGLDCVTGIKKLMVVVEMARQDAARKGSARIDYDSMHGCAMAVGLVE